jgi:class 3 adenylate cyclase
LGPIIGRLVYSGPPVQRAESLRDVSASGQVLVDKDTWDNLAESVTKILKVRAREVGELGPPRFPSRLKVVQLDLPGLPERQFPPIVNDQQGHRNMFIRKFRLQQKTLPRGKVACVSISIKNMENIQEKNHAAFLQALLLYEEIIKRCSAYWHGHELKCDNGVFESLFKELKKAVAFALMCHEKLKEAPWAPDILELPEASTTRGGSHNILVHRGLRAKIGIDYGLVLSLPDSLTGTFRFRGNVLLRAASLRNYADGGQTLLCQALLPNLLSSDLQQLKASTRDIGFLVLLKSGNLEPISQIVKKELNFYNFVVTPDNNLVPSYERHTRRIQSGHSEMWALVENELRAIESPTCDAPRRLCEVCKEALSPCSDWVSVGSKSFHRQHFTCVCCKHSLIDRCFVESQDSKFYCTEDYERIFAKVCASCNGKIDKREAHLKACGKYFHSDHFLCAHCGINLKTNPFMEVYGQPYCLKDFEDYIARRCAACHMPIEDVEFVEAKDNSWHVSCFKCEICYSCPEENQTFYIQEGNLLCRSCRLAQESSSRQLPGKFYKTPTTQ